MKVKSVRGFVRLGRAKSCKGHQTLQIEFPDVVFCFMALQQYQHECSLSDAGLLQRQLSEPLNFCERAVVIFRDFK